MDMCAYSALAVRLTPRTLSMITALNDEIEPEIRTYPEYFMIYCVDSDHEERAIIDEETFERTYGKMPDHVVATYVDPID